MPSKNTRLMRPASPTVIISMMLYMLFFVLSAKPAFSTDSDKDLIKALQLTSILH